MNKKQLPKLILMTDALTSRALENIVYFIDIKIEYKSGNQTYTGLVTRQDDVFFFTQGGERKKISLTELGQILAGEALKYDMLTVTYRERGQTITLTADDKGVKSSRIEQTQTDAALAANPLLKEKKYLLTPSKAGPLLKVLGIMTEDGKIKNDMIRKYNQIDRFLSLVSPLFSEMDEEIVLLDCGCGKSYLSFALNFLLREILKKKCHIYGVDINENVISASRDTAQQLSYHNMEFICADLAHFNPSKKINTVVSLHACDTATDMALGLAVNLRASNIICVPCCHKELKDSLAVPHLEGILRHGVFRSRLNDVITDGLRTLQLEALGYKVQIVEYVSPIDTPKNLLMQAKKVSPPNREKQGEYDALCQTLKVSPSFTYRYLDPALWTDN